MAILSPCLNCDDRKLIDKGDYVYICHSDCPKYLKYKMALKDVNDKKHFESKIYYSCNNLGRQIAR